MGARDLQVSSKWDDKQCVVIVKGEIDFSNVGVLQEALMDVLDDGGVDLVFDLCRVDYIDSEGIRSLLQIDEMLHRSGGTMIIRDCSGMVSKVLRILGLEGYWRI